MPVGYLDPTLTRSCATGPLVRISPIELSIDDTDAHNNVLYGHATNFMKVGTILHPTSAIGSY